MSAKKSSPQRGKPLKLLNAAVRLRDKPTPTLRPKLRESPAGDSFQTTGKGRFSF
jgi:hypothetical protein